MLQNEIKNGFIELGKFLSQFSENVSLKKENVLHNELFFNAFQDLILLSKSHNGCTLQKMFIFLCSRGQKH